MCVWWIYDDDCGDVGDVMIGNLMFDLWLVMLVLIVEFFAAAAARAAVSFDSAIFFANVFVFLFLFICVLKCMCGGFIFVNYIL